MYSTALMTTALVYEASKARMDFDRIFTKLEDMIEDRLPDEVPERAECTGSILCERQGVRHKADCYGKPLGLQW